MGLVREFVSALRTVFGPCKTDVRDSANGAFTALLVAGPAELYGFRATVGTGDATARFAYVDASATGTATAAIIRDTFVNTNPVYARPIRFDKGLVISATATGTSANWTIVTFYNPLPQPFGGAG